MSNAADQSEETPVIELKDVRVHFKARAGSLFRPKIVKAVDGVDFSVRRGETIGIVGESGCGKSTMASVLVGLQAPTSGQRLFRGRPLGPRAAERRAFGRAVTMVFQDASTALNPRMTVHDILVDPLRVHGVGDTASRTRRVHELLELVGLPSSAAEVSPTQISGGQRQRVAIARALALEPEVVVADEPTSALDVSVRAQVLNLLSDLKSRLNLGMVFISHDIQTVRYVSDRICVMNGGRIVEEGPAQQVFDSPADAYTRTLLGAAPSLLHLAPEEDRGTHELRTKENA
ncbi:ATP-binding cassette domain-containing protein [Arthrobacter sp. UM1]|uniref:ATP-binding cassette domain-containing protein n=1 Tax=Arthrobacter sp. UM1 TaxID=2766776 RepID=UPI001CF6F981|nr:ATP-binding cassette domain-containing protein [Arthrobacter sp. UM1]MCB4208259.1 ABC transporter ATP-binding protein [Arthrobacter sp. UM1]